MEENETVGPSERKNPNKLLNTAEYNYKSLKEQIEEKKETIN